MPEENSIRAELDAAFTSATPADPAQEADKTPASIDPPVADKPADPALSAADKADKEPAKDPAKKSRSLEPPVRWTKEEKEQWEAMIDDGMDEKQAEAIVKAQKVLLNRNKSIEGWFTKEMQGITADRNAKAEFDKVLQPHRQMWANSGLSDAAAVKELLDGYAFSNRDPVGFIRWIAQSRGIDLNKALGVAASAPTGGSEDQVELHPAVKAQLDAQNATITKLQQQLGQFGGAVQQRQQADDAALAQTVENEIAQFEAATDEAGQPKYPFFSQVRNDMALLIGKGIATDYADAYDRAVYGRPELRKSVLESHELRVKRDLEAKLKSDAAAARRSAGGIAPSGSGLGAPPPAPAGDGSVRSILEATMQTYASRQRV